MYMYSQIMHSKKPLLDYSTVKDAWLLIHVHCTYLYSFFTTDTFTCQIVNKLSNANCLLQIKIDTKTFKYTSCIYITYTVGTQYLYIIVTMEYICSLIYGIHAH